MSTMSANDDVSAHLTAAAAPSASAIAERFTTYSLVGVLSKHPRGINGFWLQNHVGTLSTARAVAEATSAINSGMSIAIIDKINSPCPQLSSVNQVTPLVIVRAEPQATHCPRSYPHGSG